MCPVERSRAVKKKRTFLNMCCSFLAMVVCGIMLSELEEDMLQDTNHMKVPPTLKPLLAVGLAILIGLEGEKVRQDLDQLGEAS